MFDEFMRELRRRQAEATGGGSPRTAPDDEEDSISPDDQEPVSADDAIDGPPVDDAYDDPSRADGDEPEPEPIRPIAGRGPRRGGRPPRGPRGRRTVGGPGDGRPSIRRQVALAVAIVLGIFIVV